MSEAKRFGIFDSQQSLEESCFDVVSDLAIAFLLSAAFLHENKTPIKTTVTAIDIFFIFQI